MRVLLPFLVFATLLLMACPGERAKTKVEDLRRIANETPVPRGFRKGNEKVIVKETSALLTLSYKTEESFEEIRKFYKEVLEKQGWGIPEETEPTSMLPRSDWMQFSKGEYRIVIEGGGASSKDCDIVFKWFEN